jgi:predicted dinucleotide-binding enzyme
MTDRVAIVGAGVTGRGAGRALHALHRDRVWFDRAPGATRRAAKDVGGEVVDDLEAVDRLAATPVVVLAQPAPHAVLARHLLLAGRDVVSTSDDVEDVQHLLRLHTTALEHGRRLVVGAALAPGLSGLLARVAADRLASVDEIHVATHGTGGPACARQHHDALGDVAIGWHDGEWIERPGGSGRELCWFPEPIGPADCYRAALADPLLLQRAFPDIERASARVSATRRDRLTARLPMLTPPRREGDRGAVRVEVRGALADGARDTQVVGAAGRTGALAGATAAVFAAGCIEGRVRPGVVVAGDDSEFAAWAIRLIIECGVRVEEYDGSARIPA